MINFLDFGYNHYVCDIRIIQSQSWWLHNLIYFFNACPVNMHKNLYHSHHKTTIKTSFFLSGNQKMQEILTYLDKYCKVFGPQGINLDLFIFERMFCFEYKNLASHKFFSGKLTVSSSLVTTNQSREKWHLLSS